MSPTPDSGLANHQETIDDLRRQLAKRTAERDEALAHETATTEILQVINSSPEDLPPVFDAMLEKATRLCDAARGQLAIYDGEFFHLVAAHGESAFVKTQLAQGPRPPAWGVTWPRIVAGERLVHMPDVVDTELYRSGHETEEGGCRALLTVSLRKDVYLLGALTIYRQEARPFSAKEIALVENFAVQAVIAMEHARLLTETRKALEQQTATAEVLRVINSSVGDLVPVFGAILEQATRLCDAAFGVVWTYDRTASRYRPGVVHRAPAALSEFLSGDYPAAPSDILDVLGGASFLHILDEAESEGYRTGANLQRLAMVDLGGVRTSLAIPLHRHDTVLAIYRQEVRAFSDEQIALLQNFAAQAVIAMENARLLTETREALEQQTATAEVLGVINSSPGDLGPVFDAMLTKAVGLCEADQGVLHTFNGEAFPLVAIYGRDPRIVEQVKQFGPIRSFGLLNPIVHGERVVHVPDVRKTATYRDYQIARDRFELDGIRTWLGVALRKEDALLGAIIVFRRQVRPFSDKQIALVKNFAAQAVIAMENARLLGELRERNEEIAGWNKELEARVAAQLAEIERAGKLRRFLAPQLADLIVAQGDESILESHRREIVVVFCDLRGFTGFAERAEPEEVMALLREYHAAMGPIVAQYEGTIDHYGGDGIMVFFNDPLPTPDPARRAIDMALAMRERAQPLLRLWRRHGHDLGFGLGIAQGYATLGQIGFAERMDYTAIGTVTNVAARLCAEAKDGQILVSARVATAVEEHAELQEIGDLALKGLSQAVAVFNVPLASGEVAANGRTM
jgi:class 3 adenylate cyclase